MKQLRLKWLLSVTVIGLALTGCQKQPTACFEPSITTVEIDETVNFTNCSEDANSYDWDFGDGGTSTKENPSYSFSAGGDYTVTLTTFSKNKKKTSTNSEIITVKFPTQLQMTILDEIGNKVSGAIIKLYTSQDDFTSKTNEIATQTTGTDGVVTFTNLSAIKYYWWVNAGCFDNLQGAVTTTNNLTENATTTVNIVVSPKVNTLIMSSYEDEDYYCYINGSYQGIITAWADVPFYVQDGSYFVELKEVDYVINQTVYSGTFNVSCGQEQWITFGNKKSQDKLSNKLHLSVATFKNRAS